MTSEEAMKLQAAIQAGQQVSPEVMAEMLCVLPRRGRKLKLVGLTAKQQLDIDRRCVARLAACKPQQKVA